jgi:hypothetical protein
MQQAAWFPAWRGSGSMVNTPEVLLQTRSRAAEALTPLCISHCKVYCSCSCSRSACTAEVAFAVPGSVLTETLTPPPDLPAADANCLVACWLATSLAARALPSRSMRSAMVLLCCESGKVGVFELQAGSLPDVQLRLAQWLLRYRSRSLRPCLCSSDCTVTWSGDVSVTGLTKPWWVAFTAQSVQLN